MSSENFRGSNYIGVSRNGKLWQLIIMVDRVDIYLGMLENPVIGALIYDIIVIQTKGLKANVNFKYTKYEILAILYEINFMNIK